MRTTAIVAMLRRTGPAAFALGPVLLGLLAEGKGRPRKLLSATAVAVSPGEVLGIPASQGDAGIEVAESSVNDDGERGILIPPAVLDEDFDAAPDADTETTTPAPAAYLAELEAERSAAKDAQFLMQATFGPTRAELAKLQGMPYVEWIREQMALPAGSHREYLRRRVNPRLSDDEPRAALRGLCTKGSRWVNYAFQTSDVGKSVVVEGNRIKVDGSLRTGIDPNFVGNGMPPPNCTNVDGESIKCHWNLWKGACYDAEQLFGDYCRERCWERGYPHPSTDCSVGWPQLSKDTFTGFVCQVYEGVGNLVALSVSSGCETEAYMLNPAMYFTDPSQALEPSDVAFETAAHPGVLVLAQDLPATCELAGAKWIIHAGKIYRADVRTALLQNTPEEPAVGVSGIICPNVPRTFLNEATCRVVPACAPADTVIADATVRLTKSTRATFYSVGGRYVYAVSGLRPSSGPCGDVSRWQLCDPAMACTASSIAPEDASSIAQALAKESRSLRDIQVSCGNVPAGAVVDGGDGSLWKHVHRDELGVFDFTEWVGAHPGGPSAIKKWAIDGTFVLQFPGWHEMDRWESDGNSKYRQFLGKADEMVLFSELPAALRTFPLAKELAPESNKLHYEVCGSPGEVANDPKLGNRFLFEVTEADDRAVVDEVVDGYDGILYRSPHLWSSPGTVWFNLALKANDQLRQRVAWALSQIFVVSTDGAHGRRAETYLNYYDIFVRHAFGNFRDVLREVTYSPVMGDYLTFRRNKAFDRSNNYPDENFAREIMQLFTIGLWRLNEALFEGAPHHIR